jgi:hypothetical protein
MNALSVAGLSYYAAAPGTNLANAVTISAGASTRQATVFTGKITDAYSDGRQPDMGFIVNATVVTGFSMPPAVPTSFPNPTPIDTVFQRLAAAANLTLVNNGVMGTLSNPYYAGSINDQIRDACLAANCYGNYDAIGRRLIIAPKIGGTQSGGPVFSPANGMIGYPQYQSMNVTVRSRFDPSLHLGAGEPFIVEGSQFTAANGPWLCTKVDYDLSSQTPGGHWEMLVRGRPAKIPVGNAPPVR